MQSNFQLVSVLSKRIKRNGTFLLGEHTWSEHYTFTYEVRRGSIRYPLKTTFPTWWLFTYFPRTLPFFTREQILLLSTSILAWQSDKIIVVNEMLYHNGFWVKVSHSSKKKCEELATKIPIPIERAFFGDLIFLERQNVNWRRRILYDPLNIYGQKAEKAKLSLLNWVSPTYGRISNISVAENFIVMVFASVDFPKCDSRAFKMGILKPSKFLWLLCSISRLLSIGIKSVLVKSKG